MTDGAELDRTARWWRNEYLWALLILTAVTVVFFNPVFRFNANFSAVYAHQRHTYPWVKPGDAPVFGLHDQADYVHPRQVFLDRSLKEEHEVPLWNPLTFGGHPFFAETGSRLAYPPFVALTALLGPTHMHDAYLMLHFVGAGLAMFALMKHFRASFAGAVVAAVTWAFSSYGVLYSILEMYPGVAALLPVVVLLIHRWHERRSWRSLLLAGLALGLLYLGTSAELAFFSFVFAFGYSAVLAATRLVRERKQLSLREAAVLLASPGILVGAATAVAAVSILPFLELLGRSGGDPLPYEAIIKVFRPIGLDDWAKAFSPPDLPATLNSISQQLFLGTATAVLAVVGLLSRTHGAALGRGAAAAVVVYAAGGPGTWLAYRLPGFSKIHGVGRALFILNLGVAVLAGLGLDRLLRAGWPFRRRSTAEAAADPPRREGERWRTAGAVALTAACLGTAVLQLFTYARAIHPPFQERGPEFNFPPTAATEAARAAIEQGGRGRLLPMYRLDVPRALGYTLPAATAMALDLHVNAGYEPVLPERTYRLWRLMAGEPLSSVLTTEVADTAVNAQTFAGVARVDLLPRLGVSALLGPPTLPEQVGWDREVAATRGLRLTYTGPDGVVYEVVNRTGRAFVVHDAVTTGSADDSLRLLESQGFDVRKQVILEGDGAATAPGGTGPGPGPSAVRWLHDGPNRVTLEVDAPAKGWLVLLDNWDPGWRATVDGRSTEILRANYAFRAIPLEAGTSVVRFSYRPTPVVAGALVSASATLAILWLAVWGPVRRRLRRDTDASGRFSVRATLARLRTADGGKVVRYSVASIVNVLIGQVILVITFGLLHWSAVSASILAACVAAVPGYLLARRWVWGRSGRSHLVKEVLPFWGLALVGLAFTTWSAGIAEGVGTDLGVSRFVQTLIVMIAVLAASGLFWVGRFVLLNRVLFAERG